MSDLIKRIDAYTDKEFDEVLWGLLEDCRAEIERLTQILEVTDENHGRTTVLAHKALKDLDIANAEIERLKSLANKAFMVGDNLDAEIERLTQSNQSLRDQNTALDEKLAEYSERKYVPMTEDELERVWNNHKFGFGISNVSHANRFNLLKALESEVIRRAGLEVES